MASLWAVGTGSRRVIRLRQSIRGIKKESTMGLLIEGIWHEDDRDARIGSDGAFIRPQTRFRSFVTPDGSPGLSGTGGFKAEAGRYHLYVAQACPWAHRTLIFRRL